MYRDNIYKFKFYYTKTNTTLTNFKIDRINKTYDTIIGNTHADFRRLMVKVILEAGEIVIKKYKTPQKTIEKGITDYTTMVDLEAEKLITSGISAKFSNHSILGEESGGDTKSEYAWIIDPIDGTFNFSFGLSFFAVSIGLMNKNNIILGAIYDPVLDELFFAQKDVGAFLWNKQIFVSQREKLIESVICSDLSYNFDLATKNFVVMKKLASKVRTQRLLGSAALAMAYLCCGRIDGFIHNDIKTWDVAAAVLMLDEAGGKITSMEGNAFSLLKENKSLVATNELLHNELLTNINK